MAEPDERGLLKQFSKNLRPRFEGEANPRGIAATGLSAFNPLLGLLSAIPFARLVKMILGGRGGDGQGEIQSGDAAAIADALGIQIPVDAQPLSVGSVAGEGLPENPAGDIGAVDLTKILFDPALAAQATTPDTFDRTDFATQAMQAFTAAQNDALVNQLGQQGGPIANFSGFLGDPNARFGPGLDEVAAALGHRMGGSGKVRGGGDIHLR